MVGQRHSDGGVLDHVAGILGLEQRQQRRQRQRQQQREAPARRSGTSGGRLAGAGSVRCAMGRNRTGRDVTHHCFTHSLLRYFQ
jgi:hypothetical protein